MSPETQSAEIQFAAPDCEVFSSNETPQELALIAGLVVTLITEVDGQLHLYVGEERGKKDCGKKNVITETIKNKLGKAFESFWTDASDENRRVLLLHLRHEVARALSEEYGRLPKGATVSVVVELAPVVLNQPEYVNKRVCMIQVLAHYEGATGGVPPANFPETYWEVEPVDWLLLHWSEGQWWIGNEALSEINFRNFGRQGLKRRTPESIQRCLLGIQQARIDGWDQGDFFSFRIRAEDQVAASKLPKEPDYEGSVSPTLFQSPYFGA